MQTVHERYSQTYCVLLSSRYVLIVPVKSTVSGIVKLIDVYIHLRKHTNNLLLHDLESFDFFFKILKLFFLLP